MKLERTFLDLRICRNHSGHWHLKQDVGPTDATDEHWVILAAEQLDALARMAGYMPADEITKACERERERLALLAAMVQAHTGQGDPLRVAAALLLTGAAPYDPTAGQPNPGASDAGLEGGQLELV
ncbi:hypothetical protein IAI53_03155 [Thauera sp. CAU 1555]|uniref:Uncharacterized protein n=1 Tax=Thauera sedimentorum TaxID=2767595 RepID=A0ABR9B674_9RHOO|nr:hypothetical protein [Thauera sedimentorum]MBC9070952.1 hypothetical protein [Thauera sedimentorum]MBD8501871.1 hypothetical protein [Thauera sedimentorum]